MDRSTPRVRNVRKSDRAEHVRMRAALWPEAAVDELEAELDQLLSNPDVVVFVAERDNGSLCGLVEAGVRPFANGVDEQPCAFVEGWWVDPDVRRSGVGRALISAIERWARGRGFHQLGSDTEIDNVISQAAHRALGFEELERTVWFRKQLT
jgi:aminoglycoside 6'-N-acetyltransferase I